MSNYAQPYRNLPAEIRLQIWSLVIPQRVTITRGLEPDYVAAADQNGHLGLVPSLQVQLLRLNSEIYHEILPMLKKVEVHLHCYIDYDSLWYTLSESMQSPLLDTLYYPWHCPGGYHVEHFLPKLLTEGSPRSLRCLYIIIIEAQRPSKMIAFSDRKWPIGPVSCYLPEQRILAAFSGACLQKGTASDQIVITVEEIERQERELWSCDRLYAYMRAEPCEPSLPAALAIRAFHRHVQEYAGPIEKSNIEITTNFREADRSSKYGGTITFSRVS